jgi:hypothetical protein
MRTGITHSLRTLLIITLSIIYVHVNAQKNGLEVDRVVIGHYKLANDELNEYVIQMKSGQIMFTDDRMGSGHMIGKANRESFKLFEQYVNTYDYSMFMLKYKQNKDYSYVRVYMTNGDYQEAYWNESSGPEAEKFYVDAMKFIEETRQAATASK